MISGLIALEIIINIMKYKLQGIEDIVLTHHWRQYNGIIMYSMD